MAERAKLGALLDADWQRLRAFSGLPPSRRRWRDNLHPRFACVTLLRAAHAAHGLGRPGRVCAKVLSLINFLLFGLEAPPRLSIGPGLVLPHPQGTIIGASEVGANATIYQQVTLGAKTADFAYDSALRPRVGNDVTLTAGAKVLGPIHLGDGCVVGANAVVLDDVPAHALAVGVPARIISRPGPQLDDDRD
jgi:serine O-acetyltransferase